MSRSNELLVSQGMNGVLWYLAIGAVLSFVLFGRTYEDFYRDEPEYRAIVDALEGEPKVKLVVAIIITVLWLPIVIAGLASKAKK